LEEGKKKSISPGVKEEEKSLKKGGGRRLLTFLGRGEKERGLLSIQRKKDEHKKSWRQFFTEGGEKKSSQREKKKGIKGSSRGGEKGKVFSRRNGKIKKVTSPEGKIFLKEQVRGGGGGGGSLFPLRREGKGNSRKGKRFPFHGNGVRGEEGRKK